jgi:hypothetical protein
MLPPKEDQRWSKLVRNEIHHDFKSVPAGLMVSRLNRQLTSGFEHRALEQCVDELYGFFQKYERLLEEDLNAIFA